MHFSYVIFLSETWINRENVLNDDIKIVGYGSHFNCYNKKTGKRTTVFYKMFVNAKRLHSPPVKLGGGTCFWIVDKEGGHEKIAQK